MNIPFCLSVLVVLLSILFTFSVAERFDDLPENQTYLNSCFDDCEKTRQGCLNVTPTGDYCDFSNQYCIQDCIWTSKFK